MEFKFQRSVPIHLLSLINRNRSSWEDYEQGSSLKNLRMNQHTDCGIKAWRSVTFIYLFIKAASPYEAESHVLIHHDDFVSQRVIVKSTALNLRYW